jgi:CRP/FNR family cyclic AMP-dependent transcriptional regulator
MTTPVTKLRGPSRVRSRTPRPSTVIPPSKGDRPRIRVVQAERAIRLFDADPELFHGVEEEMIERVRGVAVAEVVDVKRGSCTLQQSRKPHFGVLLLDGVLARRAQVAGASCCELVGPGDVVRPWLDCGESSPLPTQTAWQALVRSSVAVLDDRFAYAVRLWPQVPAALMDRLLLRGRWLEFQLAVCQRKTVEERLHLMLWQFAYRWGTVTPEGVALRLPLTHHLLAEIVGAERPTVTTALGCLREAGLIQQVRGRERGWLLAGKPPGEVQHVAGRL